MFSYRNREKNKKVSQIWKRFFSISMMILICVWGFFPFILGGGGIGKSYGTEFSRGGRFPRLTFVITGNSGDNLENISKAAMLKSNNSYSKATFLIETGNFTSKDSLKRIYEDNFTEYKAMSLAGYDVAGIGARELARGKGFSNMLKNASSSGNSFPKPVISNVDFEDNADESKTLATDLKDSIGESGENSYVIIDKGNVKVGVIKVLGEDSSDTLKLSDPISTAVNLSNKISEERKVDFLLCIVEGDKSTALSKEIAEKATNINLVIDASSTQTYSTPVDYKGGEAGVKNTDTLIYGRGSDSQGAVISYTVGNSKKYGLYSFKVSPLDDSIRGIDKVSNFIKDSYSLVENEIYKGFGLKGDDVAGLNEVDFSFRNNIEEKAYDGLSNLVADGYSNFLKNSAAEDSKEERAIGVFSPKILKGTLPKGNVTERNLYNLFRTYGEEESVKGIPLVKFYLSGEDILQIAEYNRYNSGKDKYLSIGGLRYSYNENRFKYNKVFESRLMNTPIENGKDGDKGLKLDPSGKYPVITDILSFEEIFKDESLSNGDFSISPMYENGDDIDFEAILKQLNDGDKTDSIKELKGLLLKTGDEIAVSWYSTNLQIKANGIGEAYGAAGDGRIIKNTGNSLITKLKAPNSRYIRYYVIGGAVAVILVGLLVVVSVMSIRGISGMRRRKNSIFSHRKNRYKSRMK